MDGIEIRQMVESDIEGLVATFLVWHKYRAQYLAYLEQQVQGERTVLVAFEGEKVVGYVTIVWVAYYDGFRARGIPEIMDLNVITAYQRRGIGTALIAAAEQVARTRGVPTMGIGVEQTPAYAAPNRLYPKLGYLPDGRGLSGGVLHLTKEL
jgi:GNAT superfamily N-acetyltransferase